jgi:mono/diheme cytochrome c family protein
MSACIALLLTLGQEPAGAPGLAAEAADGERRVSFVAPTPHFTLASGESIHPRLSPAFSFAASGLLRIVQGGAYTIRADARVFLDGREVRGPIELAVGEHPVRIEFAREAGRPARLQVTWESASFKEEPMPGQVLFHRGDAAGAAAERGREIAERLDCFACHAAPGAPVRAWKAPDLSHVGSRADVKWIAKWLEDPRRFRTGAAMPALLDAAERADVAAYLAGLREPGGAPREAPSDPFRLERGKELFEKIGCAACHGTPELSLAGLGSKTDAARLARYLMDPLKVDPSGRMPFMFVSAEEASLLAEYLVLSRNPEFEAAIPAGDRTRGREIVRTRGCLACHALDDGGPLENALRPPAFAALPPDKECRVARYGLPKSERDDLAAYGRAFVAAPDRAAAPAHEFARSVRFFRCTACHVLGDSSPVGLAELPPPLTDAGNKLRESWLRAVLTQKKRVRPWMDLRMPHFGEANVAPLVGGFAAAAGAVPGDGDLAAAPPDLVRDGAKLVGRAEGAFSCISCHDFKDYVSLGTRGPDLTEMSARMKPEWFRRWMRDPGRLQPGTAMPAFFGSTAPAEAERRIDLLWAGLTAGKDMPTPAGFEAAASFRLAVTDDPVVVRTFMPDASPRAIAVGLPGGTSYCWDADACRLRYAWRGDFLNMAPAWAGRGGLPAVVLGERFWTAADAFPLRIGDASKVPAPKYRAYRLVQKIPEFLYTLDGVEVAERITAARDGLAIEYRVKDPPGDVWFVPGSEKSVSFTASAGEWSDRRLRVPANPEVRFNVTMKQGAGK